MGLLPFYSFDLQSLACEFPEHDAYADRYVEGMLGPVLRNYDRKVCRIDNALLHSIDLVPEYQGIADSSFSCIAVPALPSCLLRPVH